MRCKALLVLLFLLGVAGANAGFALVLREESVSRFPGECGNRSRLRAIGLR